jgi:hypothetical protein
MAAGDRTIKVQNIRIARGAARIDYQAEYVFFVEDSTATKHIILQSVVMGNFGTPGNFATMTGAQMNAQVIADVTAAQANGVPAGVVS